MNVRKVGTILVVAVVGAVAIIGLSGGTSQVPRTPDGLPDMPSPFLGVALLGSGGTAAAVDAYGNIVELRSPGPGGPAFISTPYRRQAAGSVDARTGIVIGASSGSAAPRPLWESEQIAQRYIGRSNVLETTAEIADSAVSIRDAIASTEPLLGREITIRPIPSSDPTTKSGAKPAPSELQLEASFNFDFGVEETFSNRTHTKVVAGSDGAGSFTATDGARSATCAQAAPVQAELEIEGGHALWRWRSAERFTVSIVCRFGSLTQPALTLQDPSGAVATAIDMSQDHAGDALKDAAPLAKDAPLWARRLYERSLLALLALSDQASGATPAALRDHWHYIWPRDAALVALALSEAGLKRRAKTVATFVAGLDAWSAARFTSDGRPVEDGRHEQGDGAGWLRLARQVAGETNGSAAGSFPWRGQGDYGERDDDRGDYLANAIVAGAPAAEIEAEFASNGLLLRQTAASRLGDPVLDSAAAWAVRPFPRPPLFPEVRETLLEIAATAGPYGLFPATDWQGRDPWTAATASTAWSLAALGERSEAIRLMHALDRAATPLGLLPERADIENGLPRSATPLAWSHAFAILGLRELWPER